MTLLKRRAAVGIAAAVLLAVGGVTLLARSGPAALPPRPEAARPQLLLLTSLPLVFGERFGLQGGSKALSALQTRYQVVPIAVADGEGLAQGSMLFMAHARAQPAEALVTLDRWVRRGGRLLILADPSLEWHSERSLGDPLRPSPMFPDTGLLAHWGLRLDAPETAGAAERELGGRRVLTASPGALYGKCAIAKDRFVADCRLGRGRAIVVADADFLDVDEIGVGAKGNLDSLLRALADLERR